MEFQKQFKEIYVDKFPFKKIIAVFSIILYIACLTFFNHGGISFSSGKTTKPFPVIAIDAGHGGIDKGASYFGLNESDIVLELSKITKKKLEDLGFTVILTREDEEGLYGTTESGFKSRDMKKRKKIVEESDSTILVSLHLNSSPISDRTGVVIYQNSKNSTSSTLANSLATKFTKVSVKEEDFFITHKINVGAVIVECGFLSTPSEAKNLSNVEYQNEFCEKLVEGILHFYLAS